MESNISRDHIALEAMKCMMMTAKRRRTLWNRVVTFFPHPKKLVLQTTTLKNRLKQLIR